MFCDTIVLVKYNVLKGAMYSDLCREIEAHARKGCVSFYVAKIKK